MSIKFQVGNVHTSVIFPSHERDNIGAILQRFLTVDVPGAKFLWAYKSGQWDGRVRLFQGDDLNSFKFLTGMYPTALAEIRKRATLGSLKIFEGSSNLSYSNSRYH